MNIITKNLCIIPARGGSKRIPRKNIKDFLGKPIIAYSIETAIESGLFDEIMVSTDDDEIAEVAIKYGAKVPFMRSKETSNDFATTVEVLKEVEFEYENSSNKVFDFICCLYATAPLVQKEDLRKGLEVLKNSSYSSVLPIVEFDYPIFRGLKLEGNKVDFIWPENQRTRSQDFEKTYHDCGQWYWYKPKEIKDRLITNEAGAITLSTSRVQDIDNTDDWSIAELKYKLNFQNI